MELVFQEEQLNKNSISVLKRKKTTVLYLKIQYEGI